MKQRVVVSRLTFELSNPPTKMSTSKLILKSNIRLFLLVTILSGITLLLYGIDRALTCDPSQATTGTPKTYLQAFDKGMKYSSKGQAREFLYLYLWKPNKAKQCYELAIRNYTQALAIEPEQRGVLLARAAAYTDAGQYNRAIDDFLKVLEINSQDQHARLGIALAYEKSGQLDMAILKYEEAVQFMESSEYWIQLHPDSIEKYRAKLEDLKSSQ